MSITSITDSEEKWLKKEGFLTDIDWWRQGVVLYNKLLMEDLNNARYKLRLAELLLKLGRDEKMRQFHYEDARKLFNEVLVQAPDQFIAHYHLGVLDINEHQWASAIEHLRLFEENSEECVNELRVKTLCYLAVAYHHMDDTEDAEVLLEEAQTLNKQWNNDTIEFAKFNLGLPPHESSKPYYMDASNETSRYLDHEEYDIYRLPRPGTIILNLSLPEPCLLGLPKGDAQLGPKQAELLAALIIHQRVLSSEELVSLSDSNGKASSIKGDIKRVKDNLKPYFKEPIETIIKTHPGVGYQWNWPCHYRIIRSTN